MQICKYANMVFCVIFNFYANEAYFAAAPEFLRLLVGTRGLSVLRYYRQDAYQALSIIL